MGRKYLKVQADLMKIENIVAEAVAEFGRVDILINCAGTIR